MTLSICRDPNAEPKDDAPAPLRGILRRVRRAVLVLLSVMAMTFTAAGVADAAAYTKAVYPPNSISNGTQLEAWADLSRDCAGTYGCYNYMKIERSRWWGAEYVGGNWVASNGWNSIRVSKPYGCFNYRTTVDSYNDVAGAWGGGINVGRVGWTVNGTAIYRYKTTWSSGWKWHCR